MISDRDSQKPNKRKGTLMNTGIRCHRDLQVSDLAIFLAWTFGVCFGCKDRGQHLGALRVCVNKKVHSNL